MNEELTPEYFEAIDKQGLPLFFTGNKKNTIAVTLKPLIYETKLIGKITVPAGFKSDGCSIPRFLWTTVGHPFSYKYLYEAILHDYLYRVQLTDRKTADKVFRDELKKNGRVGSIRRANIYNALRLFGWAAWNDNKKKLDKVINKGAEEQ